MASASHAFSSTDAYVCGFVPTELNQPFDAASGVEDFVGERQEHPFFNVYPHLAELIAEHAMHQDCSYTDEFEYGLDLILDSLESRLAQHEPSGRGR